MKALIYEGPKKVAVREVEKPVPKEGQALIRIDYCGICGSDIGIYSGTHPRAKAPLVLGHEFVGVIEEFAYTEDETTLEKGSKLFLYTDGVTEAENTEKELYGDEKLLETLSDNTTSDVRTTVNGIVDSIAEHVKEAEASDDLTILLIQYEPGTTNN